MRYPQVNKDEAKAPPSKFRVIGVDVTEASGASYVVGDFENLDAAHAIASERSGVGNPVYIYNDAGEVLVRLGSWH